MGKFSLGVTRHIYNKQGRCAETINGVYEDAFSPSEGDG